MALKIVGQHKGSVSGLDLDTATVLDLKKAVSRDSGLPLAGLKLLAGMVNMCVCVAERYGKESAEPTRSQTIHKYILLYSY